MNQDLQNVNIHSLLEKCKSKKELYRFLTQDCKCFLPKIQSTNVYFLKKILKGEKNYIERSQVKVSAVPQIEGLTLQELISYARQKYFLLDYLPDEQDWVHLDRHWICDIIYTLDTENFQKKIDEALQQRQDKFEKLQNQTIIMRPEFSLALKNCIQFSQEKGRSAFLMKNSSKRKRKRQELEEVKNEESDFSKNRQLYLQEHKRLKQENQLLEEQIVELQKNQELMNEYLANEIINQQEQIRFQI